MSMSLKRALLALVLMVLAAGMLPAGILLDRRLGDALLSRARDALSGASMVLKDRMTSVRDVRMMHAKDLSALPGLAPALARSDLEGALAVVEAAVRDLPEAAVLVDRTGRAVAGPAGIPDSLLDATRAGAMPVAVVAVDGGLSLLALAPVMGEDGWLGAVGGHTLMDEAEAGTLAGLTRSDVLILDPRGAVVASTLDAGRAGSLARALPPVDSTQAVAEVSVPGGSFLVARATLDQATVAFVRDVASELSVLPALRRTALFSAALAVLFAVLVGVVFAAGVARPVEALADAADRFAAGDPEAPLVRSALTEVRRVSEAFASMRMTLANRLDELERANRELENRQERLALLQGELVQRERLAATGRLLAQLAHEIRNPVASVRNCLEMVKRKGELKGEAREFADMAVDELLRMHELAERMLDLHRPREPGAASSDVTAVARETVQLARAGDPEGGPVSVVGMAGVRAAIAPDALKQVLLNLILNAREVSDGAGPVEVVVGSAEGRARIEILDRGPGIPSEALPRIFDPFFTTKESVHGVGLGLFTAEGLVRTCGGTLTASNRSDGPGARFVVDLPGASEGIPDPSGAEAVT